ncbi:MAG: orotate phosphoribosyltransferase [Elusimicrobia bacterium]|nr:orotate phosphoribosyltransferase [Elusimicrobiota bacterium]
MRTTDKLQVVSVLQEHGAIVHGHFCLPSGLHSPTYVEVAVVLQYPHMAQKLAKALAAKFPQPVDVVVSPAMGGVVLGQEVARQKKCRAIFTERVGASLGFHRDFKLTRGERVLVVEDVVTTGHSTGQVISLAGVYGAKVVGVAALMDRSTGPLPLRVPIRALANYPLDVSPADSCPQCASGVPLTKPSKGGEEAAQ